MNADPMVTGYRLCRPEDCQVLMSAPCYFAQADGEPLEIAICKTATDDDLERASLRFGVPYEDLHRFRESLA